MKNNKLQHFIQKERNELRYATLVKKKKKKVAVRHFFSARDQVPGRLVFDSFPFSFFHTSDLGNRPSLSGERRYLKSWVLVSVQFSYE